MSVRWLPVTEMEEASESVAALPPKREQVTDLQAGLLRQNRQFLDFFWDIAKPEQTVRLAATESLVRYLKSSEKEDELKYTLKRLIEGLAATRESARPGFSLALAQVLQFFEEIPLITVLEQIQERHNLQKVKKKLFRSAAFGNFFGVLALFQSGRLMKERKVLVQCVQLLQSLAEYREHLKDLPRNTLADILSEMPKAIFEELLFGVLQTDLSSALSTPGQLHLLLVGMQKFPDVLKPKKLKKLLGSLAVVTKENIPKLVELLKMAARSMKKERSLSAVGLDLLQVSLKEGTFELFWGEAVENGLLKDQSGPCSYMCFRLLGAALPLLSLDQLPILLKGSVMRHYGEHVVSAQLPDRFKFAPEMEGYVDSFLEGCADPEQQLAVLLAFSTLTNEGYPVVPSQWKVVRHLRLVALQGYMDWLKSTFVSPDLGALLDFSTKRQKQNQESAQTSEHRVFRLRKWIIPRLTGILENSQVTKGEDQVMDIARFIFFHAFFEAKKATSDIPETESVLAAPLDEATRVLLGNSFFGLLHHLNCLPSLGESPQATALRMKHVHGLTADGNLWIYCLVRYADTLLAHGKHARAVTPFSKEQRSAWDRMLTLVETLQKTDKDTYSVETSAFQHLLLLVGIHLFKSPEECLPLLMDLQDCIEKALSKKRKSQSRAADDKPAWVDVVVDILLSLLAQPSRLMRQVSKSVFSRICPHVTKRSLQLVLDVLDPEDAEDEESAVVVTEEKDGRKGRPSEVAIKEEESGEESADEGSSDEEEDGEGPSDSEESSDVDDAFRQQLMQVLQEGHALGGDDSDEEADDETMMALDENLSALFSEQKKRIQAKKDERDKIRKEKILRREFKIKVLDLVEVFLSKQPENPLVFGIIEPLLSVIEQRMSSDSNQQEQDFLRKTANVFMNELCKARRYCRNVAGLKEELHAMMERLVTRACKQSDSSVALYCFSASLYLFRVLRGNAGDGSEPPPGQSEDKQKSCQGEASESGQVWSTGSLDLPRVTHVYQEALMGFMTRRKSSLTGAMFMDLFNRFPIMCKQLVDVVVRSITDGARQHQQGQACLLLQKALQTRELKGSATAAEWEQLIRESTSQVLQSLKAVSEFKVKIDQEKVIQCLELLSFLIKKVNQEKLDVDLTAVPPVLQTLSQQEGFGKSSRLDDLYWNVMKLLGYVRPKKEKKVKVQAKNTPAVTGVPKKKRGFLPETKKRKKRKAAAAMGEQKENRAESGEQPAKEAQPVAAAAKKKKRNRKHKGRGGGEDAPEQGPAVKKVKRQLEKKVQETATNVPGKAKIKKKKVPAQAE
ncbi:myb-binding protein 1A isoform X2 [Rhinatrema bivittatum]|uniref:myb-binding protein 1A isoform X2 n=1 Tax=Rhinatrema bivittatum TaxID=194408 RepID=UPI00112E419C|nr:myb-binding protein 1A isoform X2 [Rhinatrema bivittatum]